MKLRMLSGLACALALSGCATYDYVGTGYGGDYYSGAPVTEYHYHEYGYGYPYYRYTPGVSLGVHYYYGGRYPAYGYPAYPYYHAPYRPPVRPPATAGGSRPEGHRPPPPKHDNPGHDRPRERAPWRDLDRLREQRDGAARGPGRPQPRPQAAQGGLYQPRPQAAAPAPRPVPEYRPRPDNQGRRLPLQQRLRSEEANAAPAAQPAVTGGPRPATYGESRPATVRSPRPVAGDVPRPVSSPRRAERVPRFETRRTLER